MSGAELRQRLAAILAADAAGYSRLMGTDERATVTALDTARSVFRQQIESHQGRVIDMAGDSVLAVFETAAGAVTAALGVQQELESSSGTVPKARRMRFRIGVHLGDVIEKTDGTVYGDGVNIAARLQGLADPGGITVSESIRSAVRGKVGTRFEDMGEQTVKNIADPVRAYRVVLASEAAGQIAGQKTTARTAWRRPGPIAAVAVILVALIGGVALGPRWASDVAPASVENMAFPLPGKPSIAILPFDNLSRDADQDHLADGITENIITALSHASGLFVIARNSTFAYKGKPVKVQKVAADLSVRYVLEGSVQTSGDAVRIHAQLIDALSGNHLWAERYDRKMTDLFALQDEITERIVTAMQIKLTDGEQMRIRRRQTRSVEAWNLLGEGTEHFYRRTKADNARARELFNEAIKVDPGYGLAYALLAWTYWFEVQHGWGDSRDESFKRAAQLAEKARTLNDELPDVYALQGALHLVQRQYEAAIASGEKAVALSPNHATATALLAVFLHNAGRPKQAIRNMKKAMRLSPYYPAWYLEVLGFAYIDTDQPDKALVAFASFVEREASSAHTAHAHIGRALAYHALGRDDAARTAVKDAVDSDPKTSATTFRRYNLSKDVDRRERGLAILRGLGLPD